MSNALCTVETVQSKSLPHCLRHVTREDSLHDAVRLVKMLEEVFYMCECAKSDVLAPETFAGFRLVFDLLRDKLEIGYGEYKFPLCSISDDELSLVKREEFAF